MFNTHRDRAAFLMVYVAEAHPSDGWQMEANERDGVVLRDPQSIDERREAARRALRELNLTLPCVVDGMDNSVDEVYAGWPERMFVIDRNGVVVYAGAPGPWGFRPQDAERALRRLLE